MARSWTAVPGGRVPVLHTGDGTGPPVVLLPGLSDGLAPVSRPEAESLIDAVPLPMRHYRGLVVSYRHPVQPTTTTLELARDVAHVLRTHDHAPAWLLAHSMGAMVAQHLAADAPELVAGMVLSATAPQADAHLRRALARWAWQLRTGRFEVFARDAVATSATGGARLRLLAEARALRRAAPALLAGTVPPAELVARHLALSGVAATHDARARLGRIRCPTLVLAGGRDVVCRPHQAVALARGIPGARLVVLAGLGHGFPEQAPDRYTELVLPLLPTAAPPAPQEAFP